MMRSHHFTPEGNRSLLSLAYMIRPRLSCLRLFMHWTALAFCLALAKAGRSRVAIMGANSRKAAETTVPASAIPCPPSCPLLLLMRTRAMMPKISPTNDVMPHVSIPKQPSTSEVIAKPLILGGNGGGEPGGDDGWPPGDAAARRASAKSGISASGFQSVDSEDWALVWPLARPCAIHWRIWSALTGPYSF